MDNGTQHPQWVEELIEGKMVIHNQKLEEYVEEVQDVTAYGILWNVDEGDKDVLTAEQYAYLKSKYPIVDSRPVIVVDKSIKQYIYYKDPRLPIIIPARPAPIQRKLVIRSTETKREGNFAVPMTLDELLLREKQKEKKQQLENLQTGLKKRHNAETQGDLGQYLFQKRSKLGSKDSEFSRVSSNYDQSSPLDVKSGDGKPKPRVVKGWSKRAENILSNKISKVDQQIEEIQNRLNQS
jgi:hypothetical protein